MRYVSEYGGVAVADTAIGPERWDYVALGHYHLATELAPNMWYAGGIERTSTNIWMEAAGPKGFLTYDTARRAAAAFHPLQTRRVVDLPRLSARGRSAAEVDEAIRRPRWRPFPAGWGEDRAPGDRGHPAPRGARAEPPPHPRAQGRGAPLPPRRRAPRRCAGCVGSGAPLRRQTLREQVESYLAKHWTAQLARRSTATAWSPSRATTSTRWGRREDEAPGAPPAQLPAARGHRDRLPAGGLTGIIGPERGGEVHPAGGDRVGDLRLRGGARHERHAALRAGRTRARAWRWSCASRWAGTSTGWCARLHSAEAFLDGGGAAGGHHPRRGHAVPAGPPGDEPPGVLQHLLHRPEGAAVPRHDGARRSAAASSPPCWATSGCARRRSWRARAATSCATRSRGCAPGLQRPGGDPGGARRRRRRQRAARREEALAGRARRARGGGGGAAARASRRAGRRRRRRASATGSSRTPSRRAERRAGDGAAASSRASRPSWSASPTAEAELGRLRRAARAAADA